MLKTESEENLKLKAEIKKEKISYIFKKGDEIIDKSKVMEGGKILLSPETVKLLFAGSAATTLAICYNGGKTQVVCPVCEKGNLFIKEYVLSCKNCNTKFLGLQNYMQRDLL